MASWDAGANVGMGMWMDEAKYFNWSDPNHQTVDCEYRHGLLAVCLMGIR